VTTSTDHHGHTHRLDLADSTVREWDATVLAADPEQGIVLDRSAFYPGGGGQPPDEGVLLWGGVRTRIAGTRKGDELYLIPVEGDPVPPAFAIPDIIRTATNLLPPDIEVVRIVDIVGLDTQADGGTHVASTSMVGRVEVTKMENKGRGFRRLRIRIV
jgi:Ser-tRNA(Ala) deacylase AlaX